MAVIKAVNSKASLGKAIKYVTKEEKTEEKLILGKDCNPITAIDEMKATKEQWNKTEGRQYAHLVQSFKPEDNVTAKKAYEIGKKFIENTEKFKGHEVVMATHVDKGHIHNHFIVNSVNYENGKKLHTTKNELQQLKEYSNQLSREYGLSIPTKGKDITSFNQKKYKAIEKGFTGKEKSYLLETAKEVSSSLKKAINKENFIKEMESKGYRVTWTDTRKNITFTTPEGKKVRDSNLEKTFKEHKFSKEGITNEIQRNRNKGRGDERPVTDILFTRETSEINSGRASDTFKPNQQSVGGKQDRQREPNKDTREEQSRGSSSEIKGERSIQRTESEYGRLERVKSSRDRKDIPSNARGNSQESREAQGNGFTDKGHGIPFKAYTKPIMERKSETVLNTGIDNNKLDSGLYRGISARESFDEILETLSKAIEKADNIEKSKEEQIQKKIPKQEKKDQFKTKTRKGYKAWNMEQ